ncbi:hypothetical protein NEE01_06825 [Sphingomonas sp. MMSM24]|uniref:Uncharacterized protein n=1 Tax=Sphingomonas lycopersici TaxID=2951807 RepID=A0AA42CQ41_9SPHN|nr:hypothetical protein [Sphingomonas lycopersici]
MDRDVPAATTAEGIDPARAALLRKINRSMRSGPFDSLHGGTGNNGSSHTALQLPALPTVLPMTFMRETGESEHADRTGGVSRETLDAHQYE